MKNVHNISTLDNRYLTCTKPLLYLFSAPNMRKILSQVLCIMINMDLYHTKTCIIAIFWHRSKICFTCIKPQWYIITTIFTCICGFFLEDSIIKLTLLKAFLHSSVISISSPLMRIVEQRSKTRSGAPFITNT